MYHYQSEATQFLNEYLEQNPQEAENRLKNRGLLWDVTLNQETLNGFEAATLPKKPYTYQPD